MIVEDQSEAMRFLAGMAGERRETHLSEVFLAPDRAYKLKRAVRLPYADFSTPALRLAACQREVELNRAVAPDLYLGVRRLTRLPRGGLDLDGEGELADAVVEMRRFDESQLFDRLASLGKLSGADVDASADAIAAFHARTDVVRCDGAKAMLQVLEINEGGFAQSGLFGADEIASVSAAFRSGLERHEATLRRRGEQGRVRLGHGDLHLRNICLHEGKPLLFDRLEFNDAIATVDVLYDLAFLAMDLWHAGFPALANRLVNRYLDITGEEADYAILPFLLAVRSAIRAHVTATQWEEDGGRDASLASRARTYLDLATAMLGQTRPRLVAIGGLSGTGKTTVAEALAWRLGSPPGARILESDRIRKAMHHVLPEVHLGMDAYRPEVSKAVYATMADRAEALLKSGVAVVADGVFAEEAQRQAMAIAASEAGAPFSGIKLDAPANLLRQRVASRRPGASDAGPEVLEAQLSRRAQPGNWKTMDASLPCDTLAQKIAAALTGMC